MIVVLYSLKHIPIPCQGTLVLDSNLYSHTKL